MSNLVICNTAHACSANVKLATQVCACANLEVAGYPLLQKAAIGMPVHDWWNVWYFPIYLGFPISIIRDF